MWVIRASQEPFYSIGWSLETNLQIIDELMNYISGMIDQQHALSIISNRHNWRSFSPWQTFNGLQAGFEPAQNLSSDCGEWSCAVVMTTATQRLIEVSSIIRSIFHKYRRYLLSFMYITWTVKSKIANRLVSINH